MDEQNRSHPVSPASIILNADFFQKLELLLLKKMILNYLKILIISNVRYISYISFRAQWAKLKGDNKTRPV